MGIKTSSPSEALHVVGNIWAQGGEIYFGSEKTSISFYDDNSWGASTGGYIVIGPDSEATTPQESPLGGLRLKDAYVTNKVGIGVLEPTNMFDVSGNMAIGSSYAGTNVAPDNGLIIEGKVGIATSNPTYQLEVNGIYANGVFGTGATVGIYGEGGTTGIESYGSDQGIIAQANSIGIQATTTGSGDNRYGAYITVEDASYVAAGVKADVVNGDTQAVGALGVLEATYAASVYGNTPTIGDTNWAGYFSGPVKISGDLGIGLNDGDTPSADLHIKGTTLIEQLFSFSVVEEDTSITWDESGQVSFSCDTDSTLTFTDPSISTSQSTILTLTVSVSVDDCVLTLPTIKWEMGDDYSAHTLTKDSTYIYSFLL